MTGEITLRGRVLPIGGLKEKLLAAKRGGIKTVFIPKENVKDLEEVPASVCRALDVVGVERVDEILEHAYVGASPFTQNASQDATSERGPTAEADSASTSGADVTEVTDVTTTPPAQKKRATKAASKRPTAKKAASKRSTSKKASALS